MEPNVQRPARNLVLCSDGTGQRGGKARTNVWRIYQAIDRTSTDPEQLAFYEDGVGSEDFKLIKLIGKATGMGLSANIRGLYRWLMLNYRKGDRIYLFGFSRGAYTVRSFAGMLKHCGLVLGHDLNASHAEDIAKEVYNFYYRGRWWRRLLSGGTDTRYSRRQLPRRFLPAKVQLEEALEVVRPEIWFLGVWDTVGAVGLPAWLRTGRLNPLNRAASFHDINANSWWNACHAVAVDDERRSFWPQPLPQPGHTAEFKPPEGRGSLRPVLPRNYPKVGRPSVDVEQVLFAGAHANVGGGYPKDGLAFNALDWIATKARNKGLELSPEARDHIRHRKNAHDRIYDPRSGLASFYRYAPRDFGRIDKLFKRRYAGLDPQAMSDVHEAVFDRIDRSTAGYGPPNLPTVVHVQATGKKQGGGLTQDERRRIDEYERRLEQVENERQRIQTLADVRWPIRIRKALYWLLIVFTLALAADVVYLLNEPVDPALIAVAEATPPEAQAAELGDGAGALGQPPLSWVAAVGALLLPAWAERFFGQILLQAWEHWPFSVPILVAFVVAMVARQRLKKHCERIGLRGWHGFRSPSAGALEVSTHMHGTGDGA